MVVALKAGLDAGTRERVLAAFASRGDVEWDVDEGRVVLAIPKRYSRVERWLTRFLPGPEAVFVRLDDLGSAGWELADGARTVAEAAEAIRARFGERAEPARERAAVFYADLARRGLARLTDAPAEARDVRGFSRERGYRRLRCRKCRAEQPMKAPRGARYRCPRCGTVNRVPRA